MSKHGMRGTPPGVGVTNKKKDADENKIVGIGGEKLSTGENKERTASPRPAIDPRVDCMGQFVVPQSHVYSNYDHIVEFMKDVVVVSADIKMTPQGNLILYTAISPRYFEAVPDHTMVPMYNIARRADGAFLVTMNRPDSTSPTIR